jgi:hypothetical protein
MLTDTEYWRAAVVGVVTDATGELVASGKMAQRMFDDERLEAFNAQTAGDDASLMHTAILAPITERLCILTFEGTAMRSVSSTHF